MIFPLILAVLVAPLSSAVILPMIKPDGSVDMTSVKDHVTLLEQMVLNLHSELKTTTTELVSVKDELVAVKTELVSATSQLISAKDELNKMKGSIISNPTKMNVTVLDRISSDVKININDIAPLRSDLMSATSNLKSESLNVITRCNNSEEMINRQQQSLETRMDDMIQWQNRTWRKVENITLTFDSMINEDQEKQKETESEMNALSTKLNITESYIKQLKREVDVINASMTMMKVTTKVKYEVVLNVAQKSVEVGDILKFDTVKVNDGNGYNATTGRFTAPITGTYLFWANIAVRGVIGYYMELELRVNGAVVSRGISEAVNLYDTAVFTYVTDLSAGNQVWYVIFQADTKYIEGGMLSNYGGVLLK